MDTEGLLDEVSGPRVAWREKAKALQVLEFYLASLCTSSVAQRDAFLVSQNAFECNVAARLLPLLGTWLAQLRYQLESRASHEDEVWEVTHVVVLACEVLQGVTFLDPRSKRFSGKKWCLQTLLDALLLSKHISQAPLSKELTKVPEINLPSTILDTLLCVLVDSPPSLRTFEDVGGLEVVVKLLKRGGVENDVRMKCLEFLYFYLLPEDSQAQEKSMLGPKPLISTSIRPVTPVKPSSKPFDCSSTTTNPPSTRSQAQPTPGSEELTNMENEEHFAPNPKLYELKMLTAEVNFEPSTPTRKKNEPSTPSRKSAAEVKTPSKRKQISELGVGSPFRGALHPLERRASPSTPNELSTPTSPTKTKTPKQVEVVPTAPASPIQMPSQTRIGPYTDSRSSGGKALNSSHSDAVLYSKLVPEIRTPSIGRLKAARDHRRGQSEATLFSVRSGSRSDLDAASEVETLSESGANAPLKDGIRRYRNESSLDTGGGGKDKKQGEIVRGRGHLRGISVGDATLIGNPLEGSGWDNGSEELLKKLVDANADRSSNSPLPNVFKARNRELKPRLRSTAEKQGLLGNHLGNVGSLVEGLKRAGAWGLA